MEGPHYFANGTAWLQLPSGCGVSLRAPEAPTGWITRIIPGAGYLRSGSDTEHFGPTGRANALGGGLAVLHGNALGIRDLFLGSALNAICFHHTPHYG